MSTYCHLACTECREALFIKDSDTDVHADPKTLGDFLEKHRLHHLVFLCEEEEVMIGESWESPAYDWPSFH